MYALASATPARARDAQGTPLSEAGRLKIIGRLRGVRRQQPVRGAARPWRANWITDALGGSSGAAPGSSQLRGASPTSKLARVGGARSSHSLASTCASAPLPGRSSLRARRRLACTTPLPRRGRVPCIDARRHGRLDASDAAPVSTVARADYGRVTSRSSQKVRERAALTQVGARSQHWRRVTASRRSPPRAIIGHGVELSRVGILPRIRGRRPVGQVRLPGEQVRISGLDRRRLRWGRPRP